MSASSNLRRVLGATLVIVIAGAAWWKWSERSVTPIDSAARKSAAPFVQVAGAGAASADQMLLERADFFDPTPMFLPTGRNAGQGRLPARLVAQPGQIFKDFPEKWSVAEADLPSYGAEGVTAPEGLTEVMVRANEAPFAGFGEMSRASPALKSRQASIEVKAMQGNSLIATALSGVALPRGDFAPVEFVAIVSASGLVGEPLLMTGSGSDDVDSFFREYLAKGFRLGERLAPGAYRIVIGP